MQPFIIFLVRTIEVCAWAYSLIVIGRVLTTWLPTGVSHPLRRFLEAATEPVLRPIRLALGRLGLMGSLDVSPLILLLCVYLLRHLLVGALLRLV